MNCIIIKLGTDCAQLKSQGAGGCRQNESTAYESVDEGVLKWYTKFKCIIKDACARGVQLQMRMRK